MGLGCLAEPLLRNPASSEEAAQPGCGQAWLPGGHVATKYGLRVQGAWPQGTSKGPLAG